jgi:LCP family protein required for cell wall assembly
LVAGLIVCGIIIVSDISKIWGDLGFDENATILEYETDEDAGSLPEASYVEGDVANIDKAANEVDILLIGVDNRDSDEFTGRSDVLMFMRVNTKDHSIKLVSFMRDTLVEIDGHGRNKINTAYAFGSVDLLYQTLEERYGLMPDYYMVVNFYGMEDIINALGGVDITLESNEINNLNQSIKELNRIDGQNVSRVRSSGEQRLNGRQAVAYMRIRKPGGDAGRIARQQNVLKALFGEAVNISGGEIPSIINSLTQYVRTDIPLATMLEMGSALQDMDYSDLETFRYPEEYKTGSYNTMSVVQPKDFETEYRKLYDFLSE